MFPDEYKNVAFIAEHGSWNRSTLTGYRIMMVKTKDNRPAEYVPFATGWTMNDEAWGRPVDMEVAPDGALLVSDDKAGLIYRISYKK
jgi:glucose/arabinose dehydrogenase